jgi:hypothetical protein
MSTFFNNLKLTITNVENKIASFNKKDEDIQNQKEEEDNDDDSKTLTEETEEKLNFEKKKEGQTLIKPTLFASIFFLINKFFGDFLEFIYLYLI